MRKTFATLIAGGAALCVSQNVAASGGHFLVDDAAIVPVGQTALETWYEDFGDSANAFTAQPAHSFDVAGGLEITGVYERFSPNGSGENAFGVEAKNLWRDFEASDDFGVGWVAGTMLDDDSEVAEVFAYVPYSQPIGEGGALLHANVGWEQDRTGEDDEDHFFYGVAGEIPVTGPMSTIVEVLGNSDDDTFGQVGARFELGQSPGLLDVSYAQNLDESEEDWFTVGFAWEFGG